MPYFKMSNVSDAPFQTIQDKSSKPSLNAQGQDLTFDKLVYSKKHVESAKKSDIRSLIEGQQERSRTVIKQTIDFSQNNNNNLNAMTSSQLTFDLQPKDKSSINEVRQTLVLTS